MDINTRKATTEDFEALYLIGLETPEFIVSSGDVFMDKDEFMSSIQNTNGTFLVAELENTIIGFMYANRQDLERAQKTKWACLVYLVVKPEYRKIGIAQQLNNACIKELKNHGISHIYCWANCEGDDSIINFRKKNGFNVGHKYVWMDKEI